MELNLSWHDPLNIVLALVLTIVSIQQDAEVPKTHLSLFAFKMRDILDAQCMTDECVDGSCCNGSLQCCWRKKSALPVLQNVHILQSSVHNWGIHSIWLLIDNGFKWLCKHPPGSCNLQMCLLFLWSKHSCFTAKMVSGCCSQSKITVTSYLVHLMDKIPLVMMYNIYMSNFINVICLTGTHTRFNLDLRLWNTVAPHSVMLGRCQSLAPALLYCLRTWIFKLHSQAAIWKRHSILYKSNS